MSMYREIMNDIPMKLVKPKFTGTVLTRNSRLGSTFHLTLKRLNAKCLYIKVSLFVITWQKLY